MKTLYIVRHGKSSWEFSGLNDHERPLLEKGRKRTSLIAKYLNKNNTIIDLIMSSHAVRAFDTAVMIATGIGYDVQNISISKMLYHITADEIFDMFCEVSDTVNTLMIVGHNPTLTNFANHFLEKKIEWLPTSGLVSVSFDVKNWDNISNLQPVENYVVTPKMLKE